MKRIIALLLLLLHVNTSMFIPVMDEVDMFNSHGVRVDDINSMYEYIDQVVLGHKDTTPEDEDDDQAHYFNMAHVEVFVVPQFIFAPSAKRTIGSFWIDKPSFVSHAENNWTSIVHDIIVPPPRA